jgi:hypothetical protein
MLAHVYAGTGEEWIALFSRLTEGATDGTNITGPEMEQMGNRWGHPPKLLRVRRACLSEFNRKKSPQIPHLPVFTLILSLFHCLI